MYNKKNLKQSEIRFYNMRKGDYVKVQHNRDQGSGSLPGANAPGIFEIWGAILLPLYYLLYSIAKL